MKKPIGIVMGAVLLTGVGVVGLTSSKISVQAEWKGYELQETYGYNETFTLPEVTLSVGGKDYQAENVLIYPDGRATDVKTVVLDTAGVYAVKSYKEVGGKYYSTQKTFSVVGNYYNFGNGSYAKYTTNNADLVNSGVYSYNYSTPKNEPYLFVSLGQGDTLTFSEYIDVTTLSKDDATPFISTYVLPSTAGVYDFDHLIFTLTDLEDSNVKVNFMINRVTNNLDWARMTSYVMAYGNGQAPTGAEYSGSNITKLHVSDGWGTGLNHSFIKLNSQGEEFDPSTQSVNFWYDFQDKSAWVKSYSNAKLEVADLDDSTFFGTMWAGFPSGKAKLSVTGTDFNGTRKANFCIKSVKGLDLSKTEFEDTHGPEISIDTPYELTKMPEGKVGLSYPVPTATAKDDYDGVRKVKTSVYFDYNTENYFSVDVKDGKFTPDRKGNYFIVYTATDTFGNEEKTVLTVHVGGQIDEVTVTVPETKTTHATLGDLVAVPTPVVEGGSGEKTLKTEIVFDGNATEIDGGCFRPEKSGTYTVRYTATDYIGNTKTVTYDVTTENGDKSVFIDPVVFPKVLASGQRYVVPTYYTNNYVSGSLVRNQAKFKITDKNGEKTYSAGDVFVPEINGDEGSVKVVIFDETASKEMNVPTFVPYTQKSATTAAQVKFDSYFYGENFTKTRTKEGIVFSAKDDTEESEFTFANAIVGRGFRMDLKNFNANFTAVEFILEDITDPTNCVTATLTKRGVNATMRVGQAEVGLSGIFTDKGFTVGFNKNNAFTVGNVALSAYKDNGEAFEGFALGKAYLTVKFIGLTKNSTFTVNRLCSHTFSSAVTDTFAPEIYILGNYGGSRSQGDVYTVMPAVSCDVFAINVDFTLTVKTPSGAIAKDTKGVELSNVNPFNTYEIKLEEFGQYSFSYYSVEKDFGPKNLAKSSTVRYIVSVIDKEEPEISVGNVGGKYKVGEYVPVPKITVTDNKTASENITVSVYVYNPKGVLTKVSGDSFKCEYEGTYVLRIMAIDEAGNVSMKQVKVQVEGGK